MMLANFRVNPMLVLGSALFFFSKRIRVFSLFYCITCIIFVHKKKDKNQFDPKIRKKEITWLIGFISKKQYLISTRKN